MCKCLMPLENCCVQVVVIIDIFAGHRGECTQLRGPAREWFNVKLYLEKGLVLNYLEAIGLILNYFGGMV